MTVDELEKQVEEKKQQEVSIFERKKEMPIVQVEEKDENRQLVEGMFNDAIKVEVANNEELKEKVLDTAKTYVETEMKSIENKVEGKHKEAVYDNHKDACESYGFNEKRTPLWAVKFMSWGYNVMLGLWLLIGSFTFMPIIFVAKKISVGIKRTWIAGLLAFFIYLAITLTPIIMAIVNSR